MVWRVGGGDGGWLAMGRGGGMSMWEAEERDCCWDVSWGWGGFEECAASRVDVYSRVSLGSSSSSSIRMLIIRSNSNAGLVRSSSSCSLLRWRRMESRTLICSDSASPLTFPEPPPSFTFSMPSTAVGGACGAGGAGAGGGVRSSSSVHTLPATSPTFSLSEAVLCRIA